MRPAVVFCRLMLQTVFPPALTGSARSIPLLTISPSLSQLHNTVRWMTVSMCVVLHSCDCALVHITLRSSLQLRVVRMATTVETTAETMPGTTVETTIARLPAETTMARLPVEVTTTTTPVPVLGTTFVKFIFVAMLSSDMSPGRRWWGPGREPGGEAPHSSSEVCLLNQGGIPFLSVFRSSIIRVHPQTSPFKPFPSSSHGQALRNKKVSRLAR